MALTNIQLWDKFRAFSPSFASHTAKGTADLFTERGFEALRASDLNALNEFFELSVRVAVQKVQAAKAHNIFEDSGFIERYNTPNGGFTQRIAIASAKPETPPYANLQDGKSVDPWIVRKPETSERFFRTNFNYYSHLTMQDYQMKQIFISEYGMADYMSGIMQSLQNGYKIQEQENIFQTISVAIDSTKAPLQDTQKLYTPISEDMTAEELVSLVGLVQDTVDAMTLPASTSAFNAGKFDSAVDKSDLVLLLRAPYANAIKRKLVTSAFRPEGLGMDLPIQKVPDFGGIKAYSAPEMTENHILYPFYTSSGSVDGWSTQKPSETQTKYTGNVYTKDTHANIIGVIAQKGVIFENVQNPYSVVPFVNPAGLYTNFHASSPNNAICYDSFYNFVTINKSN